MRWLGMTGVPFDQDEICTHVDDQTFFCVCVCRVGGEKKEHLITWVTHLLVRGFSLF